jgi:hypothetical protein
LRIAFYFYPPTYADVAKVNFSVEDWEGENPEWECQISYGEFLFDDSGNLVVQVRDSAGNLVFCGVNIDVDGSITLLSAALFAGSIHVTGIVNPDQ